MPPSSIWTRCWSDSTRCGARELPGLRIRVAACHDCRLDLERERRMSWLTFSDDGPTADKQMRAVIFHLTTFGYIDGDFDEKEKQYVRAYISKLVEHRVHGAVPADDPKLRSELIQR